MKKTKTNTQQLELPFGEKVEKHLKDKEVILTEIESLKPVQRVETFEEASVILSIAMKDAVRDSGLSRPQVAEGINGFFGWTEPKQDKKNGENPNRFLSIHMFNHYLSKPVEYPIPAPYLFALCHVTGSLEPYRVMVKAAEGDIVTKEEKQELLLGKMEKAILDMQKLKKEFKGKK